MEDDDFEDLFGDDMLVDNQTLESLNVAPLPVETFVDSSLMDYEMECSYVPPSYAIQKPIDTDGDSTGGEQKPRESPSLTAISAESPATKTSTRSAVLRKIEAVFEDIALALLNERGTLGIDLKSRDGRASRKPAPTGERPVESVRDVQRRVCFPGKTEKEAWQFTVVTRILEVVYEALQTDVVLSKRDIYYRDPALFNKQYTVDRYVDDIAYTFGVTRSALNVTAVAKGLVAGATTFCRRDGTTVDAAADREGMLVPSLKDVLSVCMAAVQWILVVEKEATFRSIAASAFWKTISTSGVLVTAKGYPDLATRALLHLLSTPSPQNSFLSPPVYCLVDYDADGLAILFTYKYGSAKLAHESSDLQLPQLRWLGLRSNDVFSAKTLDQSEQGLLTLSKRDRRKARLMLGWNALTGDDEICDELRTMLMLDFKAELQILDGTPNGMVNLLENGLH